MVKKQYISMSTVGLSDFLHSEYLQTFGNYTQWTTVSTGHMRAGDIPAGRGIGKHSSSHAALQPWGLAASPAELSSRHPD